MNVLHVFLMLGVLVTAATAHLTTCHKCFYIDFETHICDGGKNMSCPEGSHCKAKVDMPGKPDITPLKMCRKCFHDDSEFQTDSKTCDGEVVPCPEGGRCITMGDGPGRLAAAHPVICYKCPHFKFEVCDRERMSCTRGIRCMTNSSVYGKLASAHQNICLKCPHSESETCDGKDVLCPEGRHCATVSSLAGLLDNLQYYIWKGCSAGRVCGRQYDEYMGAYYFSQFRTECCDGDRCNTGKRNITYNRHVPRNNYNPNWSSENDYTKSC